MSFPDKVKIGGLVYDIRMVSHYPLVNNSPCRGMVNYEKCFIEIADDDLQAPLRQQQTFWHEVIHAMVRDRGLDWGDNDELYTDELAKALHAFCVDNGLIFK